jgi:glycosyltransferase involved in cell wall biosynthesis
LQNLTLIIPAKNEEESLPIFLHELKDYKCKIIIVLSRNDFNTYNSIIKNGRIKIIFQKNYGYGNALIEGIRASFTKYSCIINADGSMNPKELYKMIINCRDNDLVFASRYHQKGGGSEDDTIITFVGNKFFSFLGNLLFNLNISDILYTYVLGKTKSFKKIKLKNKDFRLCVELPIKAKKMNLKYICLPSFERSRLAGKKKVNALKDGFLILIEILSLLIKK